MSVGSANTIINGVVIPSDVVITPIDMENVEYFGGIIEKAWANGPPIQAPIAETTEGRHEKYLHKLFMAKSKEKHREMRARFGLQKPRDSLVSLSSTSEHISECSGLRSQKEKESDRDWQRFDEETRILQQKNIDSEKERVKKMEELAYGNKGIIECVFLTMHNFFDCLVKFFSGIFYGSK